MGHKDHKATAKAVGLTDPKNAANQKAKQRALAKRGALCSACGKVPSMWSGACCPGAELVPPDDPRWAALVAKNREKKDLAAAPTVRHPCVARREVTQEKPKPFVPPEWLEKARSDLSRWGFDAERLVYRGRSKVLSAKAGKRKSVDNHMFVIEPPLEMPHEGPTRLLWHGTSLHVATNILSKGFLPSTKGLLGPGVYVGEAAKARNYVKSTAHGYGLMLRVEVAMGEVAIDGTPEAAKCDTIHHPAGSSGKAWGGYLRRREWCVKDPTRVVVREIHVVRVVR